MTTNIRLCLLLSLATVSLGLSGCNMMEGAGQDIENAGESVQNAAD